MTLNIVSSFNGVSDPDAAAYIEAVEAADGQLLEFGVGKAINDFVLGCKADGIWDAIKASCILAGAQTTNGALVPLKGTAPTPYNFDLVGDTDYNRKTGLGDSSNISKYLNSNRANNADPQNNQHFALYSLNNPGDGFMASDDNGLVAGMSLVTNNNSRSRTNANTLITATTPFRGMSRSSSGSFEYRTNNSTLTSQINSNPPTSSSILIQRITNASGLFVFSTASVAFYSIGEALDLALLDARVADLITAFGAAIP